MELEVMSLVKIYLEFITFRNIEEWASFGLLVYLYYQFFFELLQLLQTSLLYQLLRLLSLYFFIVYWQSIKYSLRFINIYIKTKFV